MSPVRWQQCLVVLSLVACLFSVPCSLFAATYYAAPSGSDATACAQAQTAATPRATINGGLACLAGGDTLEIAAGTYPELLVAGPGGQEAVRPVQPNTVAIPNGLAASQPTTLRAAPGARVWLTPTVTYPGGGGILTTLPGAKWLRFVGLNLDGQDLHGQALYLKGEQIVFTQAEVTRSKSQCISSQTDSHAVTLSSLHVHHCGMTNTTASPPPHALYICGTSKVIEYNYIHHAPNRGIQLSCEQGGIRDAIIRYNRIHDVNYGITLQGSNNDTHDNIITGAGIGISIGGGSGGYVRNNTIYDWRDVVSDTYGILASSSAGPVLRDNLVIKQRVITSTSFNRYIYSTGSAPVMSGQMFDVHPSGGIKPQFVEPDIAKIFVDAPGGDFRLAPGSPAIGVGYNGGNLGAQVVEAPVPPEPEPPPETTTRCYLTLVKVTGEQVGSVLHETACP